MANSKKVLKAQAKANAQAKSKATAARKSMDNLLSGFGSLSISNKKEEKSIVVKKTTPPAYAPKVKKSVYNAAFPRTNRTTS